MSPLPLLTALALTLLAPMAGGQSVESLQNSFIAKYDLLNADRDQKLKTLVDGYKTALKRLLEDIQKTGKLDAVLLVRDEIHAVEADKDPLPELSPGVPDRLRPLRAKYGEQLLKIKRDHAAELVSLTDKMQALLTAKETELTKEGKIDEALEAKKVSQSLAEVAGIQAARALLGKQAAVTAGWISLEKAEMKIDSRSKYFSGWAPLRSSGAGERNRDLMAVIWKHSDQQPALIHQPDAAIRFKFHENVTQFRTRLLLAHSAGDVDFIVRVNGEIIEKANCRGAILTKQIECSFPASQEIELQVVANNTGFFNWATWIAPEVR